MGQAELTWAQQRIGLQPDLFFWFLRMGTVALLTGVKIWNPR